MMELFSGSKTVSSAFKRHGWDTVTVDFNPDLEPDYCLNVYDILDTEIIKSLCNGRFPDVIWASPDCSTYSLMMYEHYRYTDWDSFAKPKTEYGAYCDINNERLVKFLKKCGAIFFIENPRAALRKTDFMFKAQIPRYTVTYCQYGLPNQKPTDIWTNHPDPRFKPPCKRGDPCHVTSPNGTHIGIYLHQNSYERAVIPFKLCDHIATICDDYFKESD